MNGVNSERHYSTDVVVPAVPEDLRRMYALSGIETLTEAATQAQEVKALHSRLEHDLNSKIRSEMDARPTFRRILRSLYADVEADEAADDQPSHPPAGKPKLPPLQSTVDDRFFLRITHPEGHGNEDAADRNSYLSALAEGNRPLASSVLARVTGTHLLKAASSAEPPSTARLELELYKMYASLSDVDSRFMTISEVTSWHTTMQRYVPTLARAHETRVVIDKVYKNYLGGNDKGEVVVSPAVHLAINRLQNARKHLSGRLSTPDSYQPCSESELERFDSAMEWLTQFELQDMVDDRYRMGWNDLDAVRIADRLTALYVLLSPTE